MTKPGHTAEDIARRHLESKGLTLVERNFRSRFGEIDLIMRDGDVLVFVEVRLRRHRDFGGAASSVTGHKQAKLIKTANLYLSRLKSLPACRFDVVALGSLEPLNLEWIQHAFSAA